MRGLFRWAFKADLVKIDPTAGIENPRRKKGAGFIPWTEDDVSAYERRWPIGTRQRVWLDVLLYTGLRRGDAVVLGRQHVRNGVATLRTEKSQGEVTVTLPILPVLQRTLDAGPTGELAFICGANTKPFIKESFGNEFREACRAAGVRVQHMASVKLRPPGRRMLARLFHNSRRSSAGVAAAWLPCTHNLPIANGSHSMQCLSSRTKSENLCPHLTFR